MKKFKTTLALMGELDEQLDKMSRNGWEIISVTMYSKSLNTFAIVAAKDMVAYMEDLRIEREKAQRQWDRLHKKAFGE